MKTSWAGEWTENGRLSHQLGSGSVSLTYLPVSERVESSNKMFLDNLKDQTFEGLLSSLNWLGGKTVDVPLHHRGLEQGQITGWGAESPQREPNSQHEGTRHKHFLYLGQKVGGLRGAASTTTRAAWTTLDLNPQERQDTWHLCG